MESNKLIAEFMDLDIISLEQFLLGVQSTLARIKIGREDYICPMTEGYLSCNELEQLQYHKSWDWLMPVVNKCFKTGDDTHQWDNIMDTIFTCDINIVYAQVVEFIKEHNDGRV